MLLRHSLPKRFKSVMQFRQFLLRGVNHVSGEWDLVCPAYNVKRMHRMHRMQDA